MNRKDTFVPSQSTALETPDHNTITTSTSFLKRVNNAVGDSVSRAEGYAKGVARNLVDSLAATRLLTRIIGKTEAKSFAVTDFLQDTGKRGIRGALHRHYSYQARTIVKMPSMRLPDPR